MLKRLAWLAFVLLLPSAAVAQDCRTPGGLLFLGTTASQAQSVWLSATGPGSFDLKAGPGNQSVDQFDRARRGLRVSFARGVRRCCRRAHALQQRRLFDWFDHVATRRPQPYPPDQSPERRGAGAASGIAGADPGAASRELQEERQSRTTGGRGAITTRTCRERRAPGGERAASE